MKKSSTQFQEAQIDSLEKNITKKLVSTHEVRHQQMKQEAFYKTKQLLKNYSKLKKHFEIITQNHERITEDYLKDGGFKSEMSKKSKTTVQLIQYVDECLKAYRQVNSHLYEILKMKYLLPQHYSDELIACRYDVDRRTIARRTEKGIHELAVIIFGVEVLFNIFE